MTTIQQIDRKIAHYEAETANWTKPQGWRDLARLSAYEWHLRRDAYVAERAAD